MDDRLEEVLKLQEEVIKGITRSSSSLRGVYEDFWGANSPFAKPQKGEQPAQKEKAAQGAAEKCRLILISIKNVFYPLALSNAHDGITRKVVDCLAETVYHLFQCSKYLIAKSSGS